MNFEININNLTKQEQDELKRLIDKSNKKPWEPQEGDIVFYITESGKINKYFCKTNDIFLQQMFFMGSVFRTADEAEAEQRKRKIEAKLRRFADTHNEPIDWYDGDIFKYYIVYHNDDEDLAVMGESVFRHNTIHFSSREIAEKAIEEIGEDDIKFWMGVK